MSKPVPKPVAETPRLWLRPMYVDDAEALYRLNADAEVVRYTGDVSFESVEAARRLLEGYNPYARDGYGRWAMCLKPGGEFIGFCGLKRLVPEEETDLGYRLMRQYWGQGLATEASRACLELAFGQYRLPFVVGRVRVENTASRQVLVKLGFRFCFDFEEEGHPWQQWVLLRSDHSGAPLAPVLRPFREEDAPAVARLYRRSVETLGAQFYRPEQVRVWAAFADELAAAPSRLLQGVTRVAEVDGEVAAFGQLHPDSHIQLLYTAPAYARRGLASALHQVLEQEALRRGVVALSTEASRMSRFTFEKLGYTVREVEQAVREGVTFERFVMHKALRGG